MPMLPVTASTSGSVNGYAQAFQDALTDVGNALGQAGVTDDDDELVTTQPRHRIAVADAGFQPPGHLDQQLVPHIVAETVVDRLEMVEIDEQKGYAMIVPAGDRDSLLDPFRQQQAVGQSGQRVVIGLMLDLLVLAMQIGDIVEDRHIAAGPPGGIEHLGDRRPFKEDLAILAAVPDLPLPIAFVLQIAPQNIGEILTLHA